MMSSSDRYTYDEVEAALCIWEAALNDEVMGSTRDFFVWLKEEEGTAQARGTCIELARALEAGWLVAAELGYDDAFDWDFVPEWLSILVTEYRVSPNEVTELLSEEVSTLIYARNKARRQ